MPQQPTQPSERIELLDVLRGFALFGILAVNMQFFGTPLYLAATDIRWWTAPPDRIAQWLIRFFAESKFYTLFSFLFGLGFSLQMLRAESSGASFPRIYVRRILVLLLIGAAHAFLVWYGDILLTYALLGLLLLFFRRSSSRTLLLWAFCLMLVPVMFDAALVQLLAMGRANPETAREIARQFSAQDAMFREGIQTAVRVYSTGTFREMVAWRAGEVGFIYAIGLFRHFPPVLGMFLLGLFAGRQRILQNPEEHRGFIRRIFLWALALALTGNLLFTVASFRSNPGVPTPLGTLSKLGEALGGPAGCFFYASAITLLFQRAEWQRRLRHVAPVGRMALSNYLVQSLICTTIFYSYGFRLYAKVGPALGLVLVLAIYSAQVPISRWWLRRFRFGPAEWLWRTLTYGRAQPMRTQT